MLYILYTDSTKPVKLKIMGFNDKGQVDWISSDFIQVPREEDMEFGVKVSEKCAIGEQCTQKFTRYEGDILDIEGRIPIIEEVCEQINDPDLAEAKAKENCHDFCNKDKNYPVYIWQDRRCMFTKDPTIPGKNETGDWHYGECSDYKPTTTTLEPDLDSENLTETYVDNIIIGKK